jgi:peptide chain release factor 2
MTGLQPRAMRCALAVRVRSTSCATGATNLLLFTMRDFSNDLTEIRRRVSEAFVYLKVEAGGERMKVLEIDVARPDLWDDQDNAKKVNTEYVNLKADLDEFAQLSGSVDDLEVLHEMAREIDDASQEPDLENGIGGVRAKLDALELRSLFTGVHDEMDAIVQINAKDGGVDAQDWSEMLLRMYTRWAERSNFAIEIGDISLGTEAGILSADFTVRGRYAYGLLTSERGTHRLVRISPFDNQGRRQTSFASVQVWPILEEADVEINETDIRMEVFRASGAGGQHVNKTSSAVRLIHEPTGLVASSQQERSQLQNRESALKRLKTMVASRIEEERDAAMKKIAGKPSAIGWGSQIRSYVMQPYQMVKDVRTEIESGNIAGVLDGDLNLFMEGYLRWRRANSDS